MFKTNYILTNKDIKELEELIMLTRAVEDLYNKLCILEINHQKDSLEYAKLKDNLLMVLLTEKEAYLSFDLDIRKCDSLIDYICSKKLLNPDYDLDGYLFPFEDIAFPQKGDIVYKRIINTLYNKSCTIELIKKNKEEENIEKAEAMEKYKDYLSGIFGKNFDIKVFEIGNSNDFEYKIACDNRVYLDSYKTEMFNIFISFLTNSNINNNYKNHVKQLTEIKYNIPFLFEEFETDMIARNFDYKSLLIIDENKNSEIPGINKEEYLNKKKLYGESLNKRIKEKILNMVASKEHASDTFPFELAKLYLSVSNIFMGNFTKENNFGSEYTKKRTDDKY